MKKLEVEITGKVAGFKREDESESEAKVRLVLEAEQKVNHTGEIRAHLNVAD